MSENAERVAVTCPACSPDFETVHQVLKPGGQATVRCTECGHVHKASTDASTSAQLNVVVSQSGESFTTTTEAPADERIAVGEEFVLDTEDALMGVRITDLEVGPEERVESARAEEVETVWTRAVDNVLVNVTIHPKDGARDETRSIEVSVPGDHTFTVGETEDHGEDEFTVEGIHVREDATGYPTAKLDQPGDAVEAKDVRRIYARDETTSAWSAW